MMRGLWLVLLLWAAGCRKAPLDPVDAGFALADASWFAEEETLFLFWQLWAEQGLHDDSVIEVSWTTDEEVQPWIPIQDLEMVHTHVPVDCGPTSRCGSASVHVPIQPRDVRLRLRWHREGELALDSFTIFNVVSEGLPFSQRSLLVYGVFDESNRLIQWRARHRFPTLRNQEVEALGLRRAFEVRELRYGTVDLESRRNPYGYGVECPDDFVPIELEAVRTSERAVFQQEPLPLDASDAPVVCAQATVLDARGPFTTTAVARKNPEVRPAFPVLRSPVRDALQVRFFLGPCASTISPDHEAMQRQRLGLQGVPTTCIDDWDRTGFVDELANRFRDAVEAARTNGRDMVLVVGLHRVEEGAAQAVEDALAQVVPADRNRNTPRLAGAFVLDSVIRGMKRLELSDVALWCPAPIPDGTTLPDASARACAIAPDNPDFDLGPFSAGMLPILPSRTQYLDFIQDYSVKHAGRVLERAFRVPEFTPTSDHVLFGEYGVVTFLDGEHIDADPDDAFSWCPSEDPSLVMFRSPILSLEIEDCDELGLPEELCGGALPIETLPEWHSLFGETWYELGIFWEFPFLLRMQYETFFAGSFSAFTFSVPFGVASTQESYYGTPVWLADSRSLEKELTQCERFCDHPTFDVAGVWHPDRTFRADYAYDCYAPRFPVPGDTGFPLDP